MADGQTSVQPALPKPNGQSSPDRRTLFSPSSSVFAWRLMIVVVGVAAAVAVASLLEYFSDTFRLSPSARLTWNQAFWVAASVEAVLAVYQWGVSGGSRYTPPPEEQMSKAPTPQEPANGETRQPPAH